MGRGETAGTELNDLLLARVGKFLKKRVLVEAKNRHVEVSDVVREALSEYFKKDMIRRG